MDTNKQFEQRWTATKHCCCCPCCLAHILLFTAFLPILFNQDTFALVCCENHVLLALMDFDFHGDWTFVLCSPKWVFLNAHGTYRIRDIVWIANKRRVFWMIVFSISATLVSMTNTSVTYLDKVIRFRYWSKKKNVACCPVCWYILSGRPTAFIILYIFCPIKSTYLT